MGADGRATTLVAVVAMSVVRTDARAPAFAACLTPPVVRTDTYTITLATLYTPAVVRTDTHPTTLTTHTALAAMRALLALLLSILPGVALQAGLKAAAQAVHLEAVREEVLLAA